MEIRKATGIILGSRHFGEADKIARVYTREEGKRIFVFKGIRKSRRRAVAATEAGTVLDLVYYYHPDRDSSIVNEFTIRRQYREIREDLEKILYLFLLLETVDRTTGQHDPGRSLYDLLAAALAALADTGFKTHLAVFFMLRLLRLEGILPDFSRCGKCGHTESGSFMLDLNDLSPVCGGCAPAGGRAGRLLSAGALGFLRQAMKSRFGGMEHAAYPEEDILDVLFTLCLFIEGYFHTRLKSKDMIFSGPERNA